MITGDQIRRYRKLAGMSQVELGQRLSPPVTRQAVGAAERGITIEPRWADQAAVILGIPDIEGQAPKTDEELMATLMGAVEALRLRSTQRNLLSGTFHSLYSVAPTGA